MAQGTDTAASEIDALMNKFLQLDISSQEDARSAEQLASLKQHCSTFLEAIKAADPDISTFFSSVLSESQSDIIPKPHVYRRIIKKFEEHKRLDLAVYWCMLMPQEWNKSNALGSDGEQILWVQVPGREREAWGRFPKAGRTDLPK